MAGIVSVLAVLVLAVCVFALPSSLMTDVKQAEMTHARLTNKVKRAQEVIMFGNQQNRGGDGRNGGFSSLPRAEKRGVEMDENALTEVTERPRALEAEALEEPKVMALFDRPEPEYAARLHNAVLKPEYFGDPAALSDMRFYDLDERRKRETFRIPLKRRGLSMGSGRAKRDLDFDPEELLALLSYWESERKNKLQHQNRNMYNQYNVMDNDDMEMMDSAENGNELTEEEEPRQDGWMDGPVAVPSRHYGVGSETWGRQRLSDDRRKRFMVSKRRSQDGNMYSLAQLLNGPQREVGGGFAYRRRRYAL